MPKRPRAHVIEDLARAHLSKACSSLAWTVEFLNKDYGEDALVRIFESEKATPWAFYVQLKSTDNFDAYLVDGGHAISYPITTDHAKNWKHFWQPVLLVVHDTSSNTSYWEIIQDFLQRRKNPNITSASLSVKIPTDNILDEEGLRRIAKRTKRRFARLEEQKAGADILIRAIKKEWGVEIEYDPHTGMLILPMGKFVPSTPADNWMIAFGQLRARVQKLSKNKGRRPEGVVHAALKALAVHKALQDLITLSADLPESKGVPKDSLKKLKLRVAW